LLAEDGGPDYSDRYYYSNQYKSGSDQEPVYVWSHDIQPPSFTEVVHIPRPNPYPIPTKLPRYTSVSSSNSMATVVFEPWTTVKASIAIVMAPVKSIDDQSIDPEDFEVFEIPDSGSAIKNVTLQRQMIKDQARRRFFWPKYGCEWLSNEITSWPIPGSGVKCYPLRITNANADTTFEEIWELIHTHTSIGDVLVVSWYHEVDMTKTFNLGLRYEEDALCLWSTFSGTQYRNRLLEAYPVKAILGKCQLVSNGHDSLRPTSMRLDILQKVVQRERRIETSIHSLIDCAETLKRSFIQDANPAINPPTAYDGPCLPPVVGGYAKPPHPYSYLPPSFIDTFGFTGHTRTNPRDEHPVISNGDSLIISGHPDDQSSGPAKKRRKRKHPKFPGAYGHADNEHRANATSLAPHLQQRLKKTLECEAMHLARCWKGLILTPYVSHLHDPLVRFFEELWVWIDLCLDDLGKFRESGELDYDYSSFEDAFSELIYSRSLCGKVFAEVFAARQAYESRSKHKGTPSYWSKLYGLIVL
jgi:hypothetical protein